MWPTELHQSLAPYRVDAEPRFPDGEDLRVGYVLKRYPRYSETFVVAEILAHEAAGLEIEIFSLRPPNDCHFQDAIARVRAPVHYLPSEGPKAEAFWSAVSEAGGVLPGLWRALEAARGEDVRDVYQAVLLAHQARLRGIRHLHAHFASLATTVARLAARFAGLPYTFTAHAKDIFHESVRPHDLRRKLQEASAIITVSDYNVEHLRSCYGLDAGRVRRIYNGLDLEQFRYSEPRERPPQVVAVGRLVEKKGFADLIDACAILVGRRSFNCRIVGAGPLEDELRARIEQLGLEGTVELVGPRPRSEVIQHVQGAAAFVAPCVVGEDGNRDGLPTVLLEAMALGTPCISTAVTGIVEAIRHGETGLIVPEHDPAALAASIERLLDDPGLRVRLAHHARLLIEERFDIARNSAALRHIFHACATPTAHDSRIPDDGQLATVDRPWTIQQAAATPEQP